jgi:hypothetical protein
MKKIILFVLASLFAANGLFAQIINDGGFAVDGLLVGQTERNWGMWTDNGSTAEVIKGVCVCKPVTAPENYKLQVEQLNFVVKNDSTYVFKFKAWAAANRNISITLEDPNNGYAQLGVSTDKDAEGGNSKWKIAITTTPTVYTRTTTVKKVLDNTKFKFAFLLAESNEEVSLDDVSIVETKPTNVVSVSSSKFSMYPNPAKNVLNVVGNDGIVTSIYDLTGKLVISSYSSKIVRSGSNVQKLTVK